MTNQLPTRSERGRKNRTGLAKPTARQLALEGKYKLLVQGLTERGFVVRREELKRGLSWRVASGQCRMFKDQLVIVDRKLPIEEQVAFLIEVAAGSVQPQTASGDPVSAEAAVNN